MLIPFGLFAQLTMIPTMVDCPDQMIHVADSLSVETDSVFTTIWFNSENIVSKTKINTGNIDIDFYISPLADSTDTLLVDIWGLKRKKYNSTSETVAYDSTRFLLIADQAKWETVFFDTLLTKIASYDGVKMQYWSNGDDPDITSFYVGLKIPTIKIR